MTSGNPRVAAAALAVLAVSCNSPKDDHASAISAIASSSLAVKAPIPPPSAPAEPEKPIIVRAKDPSDLIANDQRRARVESLVPDAKGFVTSQELEEELYKLNLRRGKDSDAEKALDRLAKGKWVLFTGNIGNPKPDSCELPIRYTPKDPNDDMGLTSTWLSVKLANPKGYDATQYRVGEYAVILAKYQGKQTATDGYDVVLLQHWFP